MSCEYFFSEGVPLKKSIYVCFLRQKTSNPKGRSKRPAPVRACHSPFLHLKRHPLTAPSKFEPSKVLPTEARGRGSTHSPEIHPTLMQLFYDNIMITLATDLVQQFYTHQQVYGNQAVMITSLKKKNFDHVLDEVISKG